MTAPSDSTSEHGNLASSGPDWDQISPAEEFAAIFRSAGLPYALIGGYAVNAWATPRVTDDFDFVVLANRQDIEKVEGLLSAAGFEHLRRQDSGEDSGPDFVRMFNSDRRLIIDLQTAKTDYQDLVIERAVGSLKSGVRVATPEDVVILKLIAGRSQDQKDLIDIVRSAELEWPYVEHWAEVWQVSDRLAAIRRLIEDERPGI